MKKVSITEDACLKNGLSIQETLLLLAYSCGPLNIDGAINKLTTRNLLSKYGKYEGLSVSSLAIEILNNVIMDSMTILPKSKELDELATRLRSLYPDGKKGDYYWKSSQKEIVDKLRKFYAIYGNKWTADDIAKATETYVKNNTGNQYMRILKYFILKDNRSDLAEVLENKEIDTTSTDFTTTLI